MVGAPQASEEDQWKKDCVEAVQEIFQEKYIDDRYYDDNIKEFHEMKLEQLTME